MLIVVITTISDVVAPHMILVKTSRPNWSVPKICTPLGGISISELILIGSKLANCLEKIARKKNANVMMKPMRKEYTVDLLASRNSSRTSANRSCVCFNFAAHHLTRGSRKT